MDSREAFDFGDYVTIEQLRYGVENEQYIHKVVNSLTSNSWVEVPVQCPAQEHRHQECVPVISCIRCGVCETEVLKYRVEDVSLYKHRRSLEPVVREAMKDLEEAGCELEVDTDGIGDIKHAQRIIEEVMAELQSALKEVK